VNVVADLGVSEDVLAAVGELRPTVAIIDVGPGDDRGLALARRLRALARPPAVLLTSSAARASCHRDVQRFPFIAKSALCSDELLAAIRVIHPAIGDIVSTSPTPLWFLHNLATIHAHSGDTGDSYGVVELTGAPGDMPPLHVHPHDDEGFYVLEGAMRLHIGPDRVVRIAAGEFALAPRGVPHVYVVESERPARWLAITNGGFDRFVEEVSVAASAPELPPEPHVPPADELLAAAARHGIEILGPPGTLPRG
jgi:quercetin dioxygenase-like cupin family protein/CheY-like chemotaxis protein